MAKNRDTSGTLLTEGMPVILKVDGKKLKGHVIGAHEDGVSVVDSEGNRHTLHAGPGRDTLADVEAAGEALSGDALTALHATWVKQAADAADKAAKAK